MAINRIKKRDLPEGIQEETEYLTIAGGDDLTLSDATIETTIKGSFIIPANTITNLEISILRGIGKYREGTDKFKEFSDVGTIIGYIFDFQEKYKVQENPFPIEIVAIDNGAIANSDNTFIQIVKLLK